MAGALVDVDTRCVVLRSSRNSNVWPLIIGTWNNDTLCATQSSKSHEVL